MAKKNSVLVGWPGSKRVFADKIVSYMPETDIYAEFFCGSLSVLFSKPPSKCEIVNDAHNELINFMSVVHNKPLQLIGMMELSLTSEWLYNYYRASPIENLGDVDRAFRFIYMNKQAFGNRFGDVWAVSVGGSAKYNVEALQKAVKVAHKRLSGVHITCRDYKNMLRIRQLSTPNALIYLDPPYYKTTNKGYAGGDFNHKEFFEFCKSLKAKVLLSHSYHPAVHKYFKNWESVELLTKASHLERKVKGRPKKRYTEMLYSNFPLLRSRRRLF